MKKYLSIGLVSVFVLVSGLFLNMSQAFAIACPPGSTTDSPTSITTADATLNGTNGCASADNSSFWVSTAPDFDVSTPSIPDGVYSTPVLGAVGSEASFSASLSLVTTSGIITGGVPGNMPAITPNTTYYYVAWTHVSGDPDTWYHGEILSLTTLPAFSTVSGMKWNDANSDRQDDEESTIDDWGIDLFEYSIDEETETIIIESESTETVTTNSDGYYTFENLDPNLNYIVCEENRSGWEQTSPISASDGTHLCANETVGYQIQSTEVSETFSLKDFGNHEIDVCPNIEASQSEVPEGYYLSDGVCVQDTQSGGSSSGSRPHPFNSPVVTKAREGNNDGGQGEGQVLGVETFQFVRDLRYGMKGDDVLELHKRLTILGFYSRRIDDLFGRKLEDAVKAFQKANPPLVVDGIVGPLTRAVLNSK
jgi:hypothetical protein